MMRRVSAGSFQFRISQAANKGKGKIKPVLHLLGKVNSGGDQVSLPSMGQKGGDFRQGSDAEWAGFLAGG
jgi:hypothetical protein